MNTGDTWQHLKGFGYAPGNYMNKCHRCEDVVSGIDKRAITCRPCAEQLLIESQAAQIAALKTAMIAAAEEIAAHWQAHCDAEGYGPQNLLRRLEEGIPSEYGYTAGAFAALTAERDALRQQLNTPELRNFADGVALEAAHQRDRWGSKHDAGKQPEDWFWLLGYLAGKALASAKSGNTDKALHHCISSAATLANWHASLAGNHTDMRPGIDPVERGIDAARTQAHKEPKDAQG